MSFSGYNSRPDAPVPDFLVSLPSREGLVGTVMRGHTMGPIKNGWIVCYYDNRSRPTDSHLGELCIVMTAGGEKLIRYLERGHLPGTYDLLTVTGEPLLDVELVWAERVVLIQPHKLTGDEIAKLRKVADAAENS